MLGRALHAKARDVEMIELLVLSDVREAVRWASIKIMIRAES